MLAMRRVCLLEALLEALLETNLITIVVHLWMMSLREDIIQAMTVSGDGMNITLESVCAMDWKISVRVASRHNILMH